MIDTVRFRLRATSRGVSRAEWFEKRTQIRTRQDTLPILELTHKASGMRVAFRDGWLFGQVSLPRVLFGTNCRLVFTHAQLRKALAKTNMLLKKVASIRGKGIEYTRVDLVWQIKTSQKRLFRALQNLRHPELHSLPVIYPGQSLLWKGAEMSISVYDKVLKETKKPGRVIRIEIRLMKEKLKRELGNGAFPTQLDLEECYRCFLGKVLGFIPKRVLRVTTKTDFYALAARHRWMINGVPVIDLLLDELHPKRALQIRRKIANHQLTGYGIFFRRHLRSRLPKRVSEVQGCDVSLPIKWNFPKHEPPASIKERDKR